MKWLQLIPQVIAIAQSLESALPLPGQGAAKLDLILKVAGAAFDSEQDLQKSWGNSTNFISALTKVAGLVVTFLNATGVFKK